MRSHPFKTRRIRKKMRRITVFLSSFWSTSAASSAVRPILLMTGSVCILLVIFPFLISGIFSNIDRSSDSSDDIPPFETVRLPETIDIYRTDTGRVETMDFEDYVKGVVSGEMPASFHEEALKAQSVAARTYSAAKVLKAEASGNSRDHPAAPLCDSTHCQVYRSVDELRDLKGDRWMKHDWGKISAAVDATRGQLLYYDGQLVEQALFHSSSGGKTENSEDVFAAAVPYLVSVDSPYEEEATHQNEKHSFTIQELTSAFTSAYPEISFGAITPSTVEIVSHSSGGRVDEIQIGAATLSGRQVREALELPSAMFDVDIDGDTVTFTSNGSGHGVGLSQYGADGMAKAGYDYKKILSHYYSGVEVY